MRNRLAALLALLLAACAVPLLVAVPGAAADGPVSRTYRVTTDDGVTLAATLTGAAPMRPRPTVVEFSPYGRDSGTLSVTDDYNFLLVQDRGTGDSDGSFDAMGPRMQADLPEVLRWACGQSWSNGDLALNGFSASAIIVYNSLHEKLPCVRAAVLKSGTFELYRDLLVPGGINNIVPGAGVLALIGAPALTQGADRLQRDPASALDVLRGLFLSGIGDLAHPRLDSWWRERGFRGDVNRFPTLLIDGWFDVESRGAFQAFQRLRDEGAEAHLLVVGGHDGFPAGTDDGLAEAHAWLDHYVRGIDNGVQHHPAVQMLLSDGDRLGYLDGDYVPYHAGDWPVPGTTWTDLHLDAARSHTALSLNDGSLSLAAPRRTTRQLYPSIPSLSTSTDVPNAAIVGGMGLNKLTAALPILGDMDLAEPLGLSFTTAPLKHDVLSAGPLTLDIPLATTAPRTGIWAVLCDVAPDGTSHPLTVGRLNTAFPGIDEDRSLYRDGELVQPYGDYGTSRPARLLQTRTYHVEFWPVGNRFRAGHRLRLDIVGTSAASLPFLPALNTIRVGGRHGAVLRVPSLPGSDLASALR